jgi:hypothetical protein
VLSELGWGSGLRQEVVACRQSTKSQSLKKKAIKETESSEETDLLVQKSCALDGMVPNAGMYKIFPSCVNDLMPSLECCLNSRGATYQECRQHHTLLAMMFYYKVCVLDCFFKQHISA